MSKKEGTYYNPLRTYSTKETAELLGTSPEIISTLINTGLLVGISMPQGWRFTSGEIERFQQDMLGRNLKTEILKCGMN